MNKLCSSLSGLFIGSSSICVGCASTLNATRGPIQPRTLSRIQTRSASHAAAGIANGPKNRPGKRLGAKRGNGEYVTPNTIIFRQRGSKWHPGENCGMGRDHTIVARQPGYVRYYRDPLRHPDRKYIGVVFDREDKLPYPPNAARKRRLGLIAVPMRPEREEVEEVAELPVARVEAPVGDGRWPWESFTESFPVTDKSGKVRVVKMRSDYSYRQSNMEIGRAVDDVKVQPFVRSRFLAWRKANARKARSALARSMTRKKGKKATKKA